MNFSPDGRGATTAAMIFHGPLARIVAAWICLHTPLMASEPRETRLTFDGAPKSDVVFLDSAGEELLYVVEDLPSRMRIMRLRLADGHAAPLNADETRSEFGPAASPDGRHLAFIRSTGNLNLVLVIRRRDTSEDLELSLGQGFAGPRSPAFTQDGSRLMFAFAEQARQPIFSVAVDGSDRRSLIDAPAIHNWASQSADGLRLVFASTRDGNYEIYTSSSEGRDVRRLTDDPFQDIRPTWSRDGRHIAFTSNRDGNHEIYLMQADGSRLSRFTRNPERDDHAAWHPDGRHIALVSERQGGQDLYLVEVAP